MNIKTWREGGLKRALLYIALHSAKNYKYEISPQCQNDDRVECGYYGIDQAGCELRGCCWSPTTAAGQPWCYQVKGSYRGKTTYIIQLYKNLQDKIII